MSYAKKLEVLTKDPISQGGLCARGQASIQITYHPDRITQPMKRSGPRGSGLFTPVSWDEAIAELAGRLDALAAAGDQKSLAYIARPRRSRRLALAAEFLGRFGAPAPRSEERRVGKACRSGCRPYTDKQHSESQRRAVHPL